MIIVKNYLPPQPYKIFLLFFITRFLFLKISGFDNFQLQPDSIWFNDQSNEVLKGNFNLLRPLFITAPFFSYFQAFIKFTFTTHWLTILELLQLVIASVSGVYFYKLSKLILKDELSSLISCIIFCFYPPTLWLVGTFTQDIWFQSFLIIFFYFFINALQNSSLKNLIISAIFFALTFLTKSHILIFSVFIPVIIYLKKNISFYRKIKFIIFFILISFTATLPYGIYNLKVNKTYVISTNGLGGTLLVGRNEEAYLNHVKLNEITNEQKLRFRDTNYTIFKDIRPKLKDLNPSQIQNLYLNESIKWIISNKKKNLELTLNHIKRFFTPGLSKYWQPYNVWVISLIISAPLYILAYISIFRFLIIDFRENVWILGLALSILIFSAIFYFSGRFRVITLEPYYIIFASYYISNIIKLILKNFKKI
jgi:hypothetical protein